MWRELYTLVAFATFLTVIRFVLLFLLEIQKRYTLNRQFGQDAEKTIESHIVAWRRKTGRWLWINFVGLSFGVLVIILFIAQLS